MAQPTVADDCVVLFHYTLRDGEGEVLDASGDEPMPYLHGHDNIVPGLEKALAGLAVGARAEVAVPPAEGYGEADPDSKQPVPRDVFPAEEQLSEGMQFLAEGDDGEMFPLWIQKVEDDQVWVSRDHPLAGVTLHFDVIIAGIRAATAEELEHGHPHGPDGHEHH